VSFFHISVKQKLIHNTIKEPPSAYARRIPPHLQNISFYIFIESSLAVLMYNILTSHMQKIIQIYPCLLKLSRKQESVTDGQPLLLYPSPLSRGDNKTSPGKNSKWKQDAFPHSFIFIENIPIMQYSFISKTLRNFSLFFSLTKNLPIM